MEVEFAYRQIYVIYFRRKGEYGVYALRLKCLYNFIHVGQTRSLSSFPLLSSLASDKLLFAAKFFHLVE